jgi:hypothetical protein
MAKTIAVCALCIISAAVGAGIDHYFAVAIEQGAPHLQRAMGPKAAVAAPAEMNVEVHFFLEGGAMKFIEKSAVITGEYWVRVY